MVSLSFEWRGSGSIGVMRYGCYASGFQFDSHPANSLFFITFFQAYVLPLGVSVRLRLFKVRLA